MGCRGSKAELEQRRKQMAEFLDPKKDALKQANLEDDDSFPDIQSDVDYIVLEPVKGNVVQNVPNGMTMQRMKLTNIDRILHSLPPAAFDPYYIGLGESHPMIKKINQALFTVKQGHGVYSSHRYQAKNESYMDDAILFSQKLSNYIKEPLCDKLQKVADEARKVCPDALETIITTHSGLNNLGVEEMKTVGNILHFLNGLKEFHLLQADWKVKMKSISGDTYNYWANTYGSTQSEDTRSKMLKKAKHFLDQVGVNLEVLEDKPKDNAIAEGIAGNASNTPEVSEEKELPPGVAPIDRRRLAAVEDFSSSSEPQASLITGAVFLLLLFLFYFLVRRVTRAAGARPKKPSAEGLFEVAEQKQNLSSH